MKRTIAWLLLALLLCAPVYGAETADQSDPPASREEAPPLRTWLILGGTVAGVTGLWVRLYHMGKK